MSRIKKAILIPVYNHAKACSGVVGSIAPYCREHEAKIILVDDGNKEDEKQRLKNIKEQYSDIVLLFDLQKNSGKGEAFRIGILKAHSLGFTHVLQLDADGQHDDKRVPFFFERAEQKPDAIICGYPEYDESAPNHRKGAHRFANWWCKVVTWQGGIKDSLCGFRVYPVEKVFEFYQKHSTDSRMGFDIEILLRLIWQGTAFEFHAVRVTYPADGISNFHAFRDNVRISWVFTKLFLGMLIRIPSLAFRKIKEGQNKAAEKR